MAYVRKTETLVDEMRRKIHRMSRKAEEPYEYVAPEPDTPEREAILESIETQVWSAAPHLRGQIPEKWLTRMRRVYVRFLREDGNCCFSAFFEFDDESPLFVPQKVRTYPFECDIQYENQCDTTRAWAEANSERAREKSKISDQFREVETQVTRFMNTQTSLNAALKQMPELELYVPDEFLRRLKEPSPKRANKKAGEAPDVQVDRDQLAALAVAHRISTAAE